VEEALRESEERFSKAYRTSPISFIIADMEDGRIIEVNDAFTTISGYTREEALTSSTLKLNLWVNEEDRQKMIATLREGRTVVCMETMLRAKNGYIATVLLSAQVIQLGHKYCVISSVEDITERKKAEIELINAKEHAEESDRLKTAFLQNMSHEIRTPMNAIMGFSSLMVENYNNKSKLEQFSEIINLRCNDLLAIINDILDISKIESGQLPVSSEECNLNELFTELTALFKEHQKRIGKQQIKFKLQSLCDTSEGTVVTDRVKLRQIFINLLGNAFKFTNTGKIEGGCKFDENQNLVFYVSDTGIGIPSDKHDVIFERSPNYTRIKTLLMEEPV
jgi:PAS domain S-box-containing protein